MDRHDIGDIVRLTATFRDSAGEPADPDTVELIAMPPDGIQIAKTVGDGVVRDDTGVYRCDLEPSQPGTWTYRWVATGTAQGAEPGQFHVRPEFYPAYRPSLPAVAAKVRSRLRGQGGLVAPVFNADTTPTADQAEEAIDTAVSEVLGEIPAPDVPAELVDQARNLMCLRAAMEVELTYYADQTHQQTSAYPHWDKLYDRGLKALTAAVRDQADGVRDGAAGNVPSHTFPPACPLEW